jgi:single-strand DNA-binding protein
MTINTYMNRVELKGFVGADAAPKNLNGGKIVLNFSLATNRFQGESENRKQFTEWHRVAAWGKLATAIGAVAKGMHVNVVGELRGREYTSDSGKVQTYEIVANKIDILAKAQASN